MDQAIIVAVIMAASTVATQVMLGFRQNNTIIYRIGELEKKQDKHNNIVERLAIVETQISEMERRVAE